MWHFSAIFKQCDFGWIFEILSALIFQLFSLDILCINSNFRDEFVQLAFRDPLCVIFWCAVCHIYKRIQSKAEITTAAEFAFHTKALPLDPHQLHSSRSPNQQLQLLWIINERRWTCSFSENPKLTGGGATR